MCAFLSESKVLLGKDLANTNEKIDQVSKQYKINCTLV
jgi:hypothetical protein